MIFNGIWSLLHTPCVNVPLSRRQDELPLGLTVTGARFSDRQTLAAAKAIALE
jgi:Asp-tRNA(Asn)/Glu-tRNA(Gln) amidotransferase A subunit family amidase